MYYYPHHIGDFIADTARLTDSQCMAYLRLIWHYYDTEKPLENDPESLAFKIGANASDVNLILKHYFILDGDVWKKTRCDNVIAEYHGKADKARKSAEARWKNATAKRTDSERNANASQGNANASKSDANQEPITTKHKPSKPKDAGNVTVAVLLADGCSETHANELLSLRKKKRSPLTALAWNGIKSEIKKAGMSLDEGIGTMAARGWQSFEAAWVAPSKAQLSTVVPTQARTCIHCKEPAHMEISGRWYCRNHDQYSTSEAA